MGGPCRGVTFPLWVPNKQICQVGRVVSVGEPIFSSWTLQLTVIDEIFKVMRQLNLREDCEQGHFTFTPVLGNGNSGKKANTIKLSE